MYTYANIIYVGTVENHENMETVFFVPLTIAVFLSCAFCTSLEFLHSLNHELILILLFTAFKLTYYLYYARFAEVTSLNHFRFFILN